MLTRLVLGVVLANVILGWMVVPAWQVAVPSDSGRHQGAG
jgi:hypothetical protein